MTEKMGLDALRSNVSNPQRTYLWEFEIPVPKGVGDPDVFLLRCQAVEEPGRRFAPIDIPFKGTGGVRYPGKEEYDHEVTVRLIEGTDAKTYEFIQSWMKLIRNNTNGTGLADTEIKADAVLRLLDQEGNTTKKVKLVGMFPQNKANVPLDYAVNDSMKYDITFAYDRWEEMA
jgi:hypothetical protein